MKREMKRERDEERDREPEERKDVLFPIALGMVCQTSPVQSFFLFNRHLKRVTTCRQA